MSPLLILLAIAFIGVAGWGFQSVMAELAPLRHADRV